MKKLLLTLTFILGFIGIHAAEIEVASLPSINSTNWPGVQNYTSSITSKDNGWTLVNFNNNNFANNWTYIKCGRKNYASVGSIITAAPIPQKVTKVVLNIGAITAASVNSIDLYIASSSDFNNAEKINLSSPATGENVFTVATPEANKYYKIAIDCKSATSNGVVRVDGLTFYAEEGDDDDVVLTPMISYDEATATVTIENKAEGADVFYTVNGDDPTAESTKYTAPFTLDASCTVKAIAILNGKASAIASLAAKVLNVKAANIAEMLAKAAAKGDQVIVDFPMTVVYVNGQNVYVVDNNGGATMLYGTNSYKAGDVIPAGWIATNALYSGLVEFSGTYPAASGTAEVPAAAQVSSVTVADMNRIVILKDVTFDAATSATKTNFNGILADNSTLQFRNNFVIASVEAGVYNVKGAVAYYVSGSNATLQFYPIEYVAVGTALEQVATPVINPDGGKISEETSVEITCATAGATIYYTLDGTDPTTESTLYDGEILVTEATIIKAIAVKAEMRDSQIAEANFIWDDGTNTSEEKEGSLVFNTDEGLAALGIAKPAKGGSTNLAGTELSVLDNSVKVTFTDGSTETRVFANSSTGVTDLRVYKQGTITFTPAESGVKIQKIVFAGKSLTNFTADSGSYSNGTWTAIAARSDENGAVTFTASATANINTVAVSIDRPTGIETIEAVDAPVEFYNLQGVRVENPANGIFIRRQGNNVSKILVK